MGKLLGWSKIISNTDFQYVEFYSPGKSAAFPCIMIVDVLPSYMAVMNSPEPAVERALKFTTAMKTISST